MTDLLIYPDSYLPAEIVEKVELDFGWTLYFLSNEEIYYETISNCILKLNEESFKWNLYWSARMANQEESDIVRFAESRNSLDPTLIETMFRYIRTRKKLVE